MISMSPSRLFFVLLLALFTATVASATEPAVPAGDVPAPAAEAPTDAAAVCPAQPSDAIADTEDQNVTPVVSGTWTFYSRESCYDMFEQSCYRSYFPNPFCPNNNPGGQSCSPYGSVCWVIVSAWWADEYHCN